MSKRFFRDVFTWLADGCLLIADNLKETRKRPVPKAKTNKPAWYDEVDESRLS